MRTLFASMPFDGHFLPLTGVAVHLRHRGHDVRFYAGPSHGDRLARLRAQRPLETIAAAIESQGRPCRQGRVVGAGSVA